MKDTLDLWKSTLILAMGMALGGLIYWLITGITPYFSLVAVSLVTIIAVVTRTIEKEEKRRRRAVEQT